MVGPDRERDAAGEACGADSDPAAAIEQAAMRLLANREHGRAELRRKLVSRGHPGEAVDRVTADLEVRGLLSEPRFVETYIASRRGKGYGPLRIRAELRERGVDPARIDAGLDDTAADWWGLMQEVAARRFGTEAARDRREQARRARFLRQRGFPPEMIARLLWE